ncbi:hypothetical protein HNO88_001649 [Novosphingobium chloroacetimidivorans]|uniref:Uncharacterized protein n=1 Tax=Novosphingobium chloroacetimidivorans TaxID=1428314 RepID=A0A7W7K997_9SPHN|nr:hypothetical protein [Novosphingobium chloroacetimidivorans]
MELDEERHATPGNRRYSFEPSFIVRGLADL